MSDAPAWFRAAIADEPREGWVEVEGCPIHYLTWGRPGAPALLLVHGGAAHARWWSHLAPMLARSYHVVAPDLSGHGDSGHRGAYEPALWVEEVRAAAIDARIASQPVLVGHSMGGFVSIVAAATYGEHLAGTVIVDSPVRRPDPESEEGRGGGMFRNPKVYPDLDTAMEHFHLVPPQPVVNDYVVDYIARHSLRQGEDGWCWKFDRGIFQRLDNRVFGDYLADARCRVAVFHAELSRIVTPAVTDYMSELLGRNAPFVEIPQAYHHLILDQPLAFVAALRAMLADWEHTVPRSAVTAWKGR